MARIIGEITSRRSVEPEKQDFSIVLRLSLRDESELAARSRLSELEEEAEERGFEVQLGAISGAAELPLEVEETDPHVDPGSLGYTVRDGSGRVRGVFLVEEDARRFALDHENAVDLRVGSARAA